MASVHIKASSRAHLSSSSVIVLGILMPALHIKQTPLLYLKQVPLPSCCSVITAAFGCLNIHLVSADTLWSSQHRCRTAAQSRLKCRTSALFHICQQKVLRP